MTYRIQRAPIGNRVVFALSGELNDDHGAALQELLATESPGRVLLDLKDVILVDGETVRVLRRAEIDGVTLMHCPEFVRTWIANEAEGEETMSKPHEQSTEKDKEAIISIVKEMAQSMTGSQSTRHWSDDALWFDIPAFASRGVQPARKFFDKVFSGFESCKVEILETITAVNGSMGMVCTVQHVNVVLKNGDKKSMFVRETDCFEKRANGWQLIHQHASVPAGGAWDGKIVTEGV